MKLRNKKTGEIGDLVPTMGMEDFRVVDDEWNIIAEYATLADFAEEWEDYEEPKDYWYLQSSGEVVFRGNRLYKFNGKDEQRKSIGNYFETEEEAEKAVEKLKAWKRLKDCGFKFVGWERDSRYSGNYHIEAEDYDKCDDKDLDLLFGGEE